jgi:hypothetical protein
MGSLEVVVFFSDLAVRGQVSASTQRARRFAWQLRPGLVLGCDS